MVVAITVSLVASRPRRRNHCRRLVVLAIDIIGVVAVRVDDCHVRERAAAGGRAGWTARMPHEG